VAQWKYHCPGNLARGGTNKEGTNSTPSKQRQEKERKTTLKSTYHQKVKSSDFLSHQISKRSDLMSLVLFFKKNQCLKLQMMPQNITHTQIIITTI
jgi:hypothetical protein